MQTAPDRFKSKFISTPKPLAETGASAEKTALVRFLQRILRPSGKPKTSWYQRKKFAAKRIEGISHGQFFLLSNVYQGNSRRHWLGCATCGHEFLASAFEIREFGELVCPFCHPEAIGDLTRIGSTARIEAFVYHISCGQVILAGNQELDHSSHWYKFYCTRHRDAYQTAFTTFLANAGDGNACPICHQERGLLTKRLSQP